MKHSVGQPFGTMGLWVHVPTGWLVDPLQGHVYGTRNGSIGRRLGGPDHRGNWRIARRHTDKSVTMWRARDVVWEAVHDQRVPEGQVVIHRNGDKSDCRARNLELSPAVVHRRTNVRLTAEQVHAIRTSTLSGADLARRYGMDPSTISQIRLGRKWKDT